MVNPDKFQAMIISCDKKNKRNLNINNSIFSSVSVTLLGIEINKFNFSNVSTICKNASRQLNAIN